MPQLMPLMWMNSVMVSLLILLVLITMYYSKEEYNILCVDEEMSVSQVTLKW